LSTDERIKENEGEFNNWQREVLYAPRKRKRSPSHVWEKRMAETREGKKKKLRS